MHRIYQKVLLAPHTTIELDEKASHYVASVLRAKVNDAFILFNGEGGEYVGVIKKISKKSVTVNITDFVHRETESPLKIIVGQGIAKGEKMDFIVQKAVELGVYQLVPLMTARCQGRVDDQRALKRLNHWQAVAISACEQCGRNRVPDIAPPIELATWLSNVTADYHFLLMPDENTPLIPPIPAHATIALLIGPEGGLSLEEVSHAKQSGFLPFSLGPRILRTETATLAAITAFQTRWGDMAA